MNFIIPQLEDYPRIIEVCIMAFYIFYTFGHMTVMAPAFNYCTAVTPHVTAIY